MIFENLEDHGCENVTFFRNNDVGLKAIVAIHDTTLGPAMGVTRLWSYPSEGEALMDALRLARGMSRKASVSGLDCGGGKALIIGDARNKTERMIRTYARFIDTLRGRLLIGQDVGIDAKDTIVMKEETAYIVGTSEDVRDPSLFTAHNTVYGMKACAKEAYGSSQLSGLTVAIQGVGHVGYHLAKELHKGGRADNQ